MIPVKSNAERKAERERLESGKKKVRGLFMKELEEKILILFDQKHLYQNLKLEFPTIVRMLEPVEEILPKDTKNFKDVKGTQLLARTRVENRFKGQLKDFFESLTRCSWHFDTADNIARESVPIMCKKEDTDFTIEIPTIKIACKNCDSILPPHNPHGCYNMELETLDFSKEKKKTQIWTFTFLCQSCKKKPIVFLVKREGIVLSIVGRSEIEDVVVSKDLPKEEKNWIKEAIVSYNCGKTLAAIFFLRTFIEQYWRRVLDKNERITGEEMGDEYQKGLPEDFPKNRCASLKKLYEDLSECLHSATGDNDRYHNSLEQITKHFEILRHFE